MPPESVNAGDDVRDAPGPVRGRDWQTAENSSHARTSDLSHAAGISRIVGGVQRTSLGRVDVARVRRAGERNNGVFGGCWCMGFHPEGVGKETTAEMNRERKLERVRAGTTHAALVFDGDDCVGWCQFGAPGELPRIKSREAYEKGVDDRPTGGSRATSSARATAPRRGAAALAGRSISSPGSAAGRSRAIRKTRARFLPASSSTAHCRPTSSSDSSATGRSASTAGSSPRSSNRASDVPDSDMVAAAVRHADRHDSAVDPAAR